MNASFLTAPSEPGTEHDLEARLRTGGLVRLPAGRFVLPRALTLYQGAAPSLRPDDEAIPSPA